MMNMRLVGALGALLIGSSCGAQGGGLTAPTGAQQDSLRSRLTLPAGFTISYFSTGLAGVRFMAIGPDGAVYASIPRDRAGGAVGGCERRWRGRCEGGGGEWSRPPARARLP